MKRREFITLLGGAAAAWRRAERAQQDGRVRRISMLSGLADDPEGRARLNALVRGLQELGWVEGRNIRIDYRFAGGDSGRIAAYAAELLSLAPDVIVSHATPVTAVLQKATSSTPVVFAAVNEPVDQGFVASLARPGANLTGFTFIEFSIIGKMLDLLKAMA